MDDQLYRRTCPKCPRVQAQPRVLGRCVLTQLELAIRSMTVSSQTVTFKFFKLWFIDKYHMLNKPQEHQVVFLEHSCFSDSKNSVIQQVASVILCNVWWFIHTLGQRANRKGKEDGRTALCFWAVIISMVTADLQHQQLQIGHAQHPPLFLELKFHFPMI